MIGKLGWCEGVECTFTTSPQTFSMTTTIILVRKMMLFVLIDNRKVDIITILRAILFSMIFLFAIFGFCQTEKIYLHLALDLDSLHITEQIFKYSKILHFPRPLEAAVPFNYPR